MKSGNDRERQRHRIEDKILNKIDRQGKKVSVYEPLKVSILDLWLYKVFAEYKAKSPA